MIPAERITSDYMRNWLLFITPFGRLVRVSMTMLLIAMFLKHSLTSIILDIY